jgi:hypothetical protein
MLRGVFRGNLNDEQCSIFKLIWNGKTGCEVAAALAMDPAHVERIVRRTCRQIGAAGRHDAARMIGSHFDWKRSVPIPAAARKADIINHFGTEQRRFTTETVQNPREIPARSAYVQDVGRHQSSQDDEPDILSEIAVLFKIPKILNASVHVQRILLIATLVVSSTLALSALVSAMQGFEVLMST